MTVPEWFEIECVDGGSATIYLSRALSLERVAEIRDACDALPASVRVLRVQLMATNEADALPFSIGAVLRHWRQTRQRALHLVVTTARRSDEVQSDARENGDQLSDEHIARIVHAEKDARRAHEKGDRNERRGKRWKGHRVAERHGHGRGGVSRRK